MAITTEQLRAASFRYSFTKFAKSITDARGQGLRTAFLCHSHKDVTLVEGLITLLADSGWKLYVDWKDDEMPPRPNRETAENIQGRIVSCEYFLFLATENSMQSRWCPWEIGYADGKKALSSIFIIPTTANATTYGNEYLELYRRIDVGQGGRLASWRPNEKFGVLLDSL